MSAENAHEHWTVLSGNGRHWLGRFKGHVDKALGGGEVAAVHGLRVASRRLTEPLLLLERCEGGKRARKARLALKKVRGSFAGVRDMDVLSESLHAVEGGFGGGAESLSKLDQQIATQRDDALTTARAVCARVDCKELLVTLKSLFAKSHKLTNACDEILQTMLAERIDSVRGADPRRSAETDMHKARIAVKRLRYAADLAGKVCPPPREALIAKLTEFQKLLGEWNDHIVAAKWLAGVAGKRRNLARCKDYSVDVLEYATIRARRGQELRSTIVERWPELESALDGDDGAVTLPRLAV